MMNRRKRVSHARCSESERGRYTPMRWLNSRPRLHIAVDFFCRGVVAMAIRWRSVFFLALFAATGSVIAQTGHAPPGVAHVGTCPASIEVQQTPIGELPPGWQAVGSTKKHYLNNVSLYFGPPEEKAHLMPSSERRNGKTWVVTWLLYPQDLPYWVACEYGQTAAVVTKPLDKSITSCTVEYERNISPVIFKRWSCRSGDLQ